MRVDTPNQTLSKLLAPVNPGAGRDLEIAGICYDSRTVKPGDLFFALPGSHASGAAFARQAESGGAVAIVSEAPIPGVGIPVVTVPSAREALALASRTFHGNPSSSLAVAGVTGTNGKTTTAWMIRHLCDAVGRACGLVGTVEYVLPGRIEPATRTTPESADLQGLLAEMRDGGFRAAAIEVSSHALVQHRTTGVDFDAAVFTNLTQDHLDYHGTMEEYFEAKALLFDRLAGQTEKKGRAVINSDDRFGRRLLDRMGSSRPVITYGQGSNCSFRASAVQTTHEGTTFRLDAKGRSYLVRTPLIGIYNVLNTTAALAAVSAMGVELRRAVAAAATIPQVPGRLERVPGRRGFQCFVDYAHTPDAVAGVLRTLRQISRGRIITVFGCGGDRDRAKRPLMAASAEELSDLAILTSDNPRGEDPAAILREAAAGFRTRSPEVVPDREQAILRAVDLAAPGDIVLIAGKGHEKYQEIGGIRHPFDDVRVASRAISLKTPTAEERR